MFLEVRCCLTNLWRPVSGTELESRCEDLTHSWSHVQSLYDAILQFQMLLCLFPTVRSSYCKSLEKVLKDQFHTFRAGAALLL